MVLSTLQNHAANQSRLNQKRETKHLFQTLLHKAFQGELSVGEEAGEDAMQDVAKITDTVHVMEPIDRDARQMALFGE